MVATASPAAREGADVGIVSGGCGRHSGATEHLTSLLAALEPHARAVIVAGALHLDAGTRVSDAARGSAHQENGSHECYEQQPQLPRRTTPPCITAFHRVQQPRRGARGRA